MIGTIRKHSTALWIIVIIVVIVTFVFWGSTTQDRSGGYGRPNFGSIEGRKVTPQEWQRAQQDVALRVFLTTRQWPEQMEGFDAVRETYQWLFLLRKMEQLNIQVDVQSVAEAARNKLAEWTPPGRPTLTLKEFVDRVLKPHADAAAFERQMGQQLALEQLFTLLGLNAKLITPQEAESSYRRYFQELDTAAVFFSGSNFLSRVSAPSTNDLRQFYTNYMSAYRVPTNIQVKYVAFGITNHLPKAEKLLTNLAQLVEAEYREAGTNWVFYGDTPEAAKSNIRERLLRHQATFLARQEANRFADTLLSLDPVPGNLQVLAETNGLNVQLSEPFSQEQGPTDFEGGPDFAAMAFRLTPSNPPGEPVVGDDAVYVMELDKIIPSRVLSFDEVRDRVASDYRLLEATMLARNAGATFAAAATNGLAQGKTFTQVCAEAKVTPVEPPPFSLSTERLPEVEEHVRVNLFKQAAFSTQPGKTSGFVPTAEGGMVVYVEKQLPIDDTQMKAQLPLYLNRLRRERQAEAINDWLAREAPRALRNTPWLQQRERQAQQQGGGGVPGPVAPE